MIKDAIKYLKDSLIKPNERLVEFTDVDNNDRQFFVDDKGNVREVESVNTFAIHALNVKTLTSLVDYIKSDEPRPIYEGYLHVEDERTVSLFSRLDSKGYRERLITAHAIVPEFDYDYFYNVEELIIALQSKFVKTEDRDLILKVIGNIQEENVQQTGDDGVSQAAMIKTGLSNVEGVKVPNPVTLAPYRTFLEVEQPESDFVFRMRSGPAGAIFEADGGAWRNKAIANVTRYLNEQLKEEIKTGRITIIA